ncbi:putative thimet oligopeptidase [Camellia lanceoleosa]|uniref:Thimet oligopeptidase n=1 Tax=Camellia lanceoleosa TaxID=1840588 RepID=A0ACC0GWG4_9ERIC|nr:putative thimet oligopeptidase [Camellia lanceoleosa]
MAFSMVLEQKELSASLTDLATRELSMLKDLKKKEEGDFPFGIEDLLYYVDRIEEQQFNLDLGALKQYFPFNLVMSWILKICQDPFGLRFEEIAEAEVFGTLMFTFIQSMTYLLVNFWAISTLICSPGRENMVTPVLWLFRMVLLSMVYERFLWHYFSASKGVGHTGLF